MLGSNKRRNSNSKQVDPPARANHVYEPLDQQDGDEEYADGTSTASSGGGINRGAVAVVPEDNVSLESGGSSGPTAFLLKAQHAKDQREQQYLRTKDKTMKKKVAFTLQPWYRMRKNAVRIFLVSCFILGSIAFYAIHYDTNLFQTVSNSFLSNHSSNNNKNDYDPNDHHRTADTKAYANEQELMKVHDSSSSEMEDGKNQKKSLKSFLLKAISGKDDNVKMKEHDPLATSTKIEQLVGPSEQQGGLSPNQQSEGVLRTNNNNNNNGGSTGIMGMVYHEKLNPIATCISDTSHITNKYWLPPDQIVEKFGLDHDVAWTKEEQAVLTNATVQGLDELVHFYDTISPERILEIDMDAIDSMMDQCFASDNGMYNMYREKACTAASKVLIIVAGQYVGGDHESQYYSCHDMRYKARFLVYAQYLSGVLVAPKDMMGLRRTRNALRRVVQESLRDCGNFDLNRYLKSKDWERDLQLPNNRAAGQPPVAWQTVDKLCTYTERSDTLIGLYTVLDLDVPSKFMDDLSRFTTMLWEYVAEYPWTDARKVKDGYKTNTDIYLQASCMKLIANMPSGYGRHMQHVVDAPWLFRYVRENFYHAMNTGMFDLLSDYTTLLRQYGCTEDNDMQVRHGTRQIMKLYHEENNDAWMKSKGDDYDRIRIPWKALNGIRKKHFEPLVPGTPGYTFWKVLESTKKV